MKPTDAALGATLTEHTRISYQLMQDYRRKSHNATDPDEARFNRDMGHIHRRTLLNYLFLRRAARGMRLASIFTRSRA